MKRIFLGATAVIFSIPALAQQTVTMDEVVVVANKTEQKQSQTGKVVTVIGRDVIEANRGKSLPEILNGQAGVFINGANANTGTNQDFYLRGSGTGNVLILIDGVPVQDASQINNSFDLNTINTAQIERIEILKGAQSTLWGSEAVAGVINIITKKRSTSLAVQYGSYGTARADGAFTVSKNKFDATVQLGTLQSKGFSAANDKNAVGNFDNDKYSQVFANAHLSYAINDSFKIAMKLLTNDNKSDIDAGAFADDRDAKSTSKNSNFVFSTQYAIRKVKFNFSQSLIFANRNVSDDSSHIGGFAKWSQATYKGKSAITELYAQYPIAQSVQLISGVQFLNQNTAQTYKSISNFGPFEAVPIGDDSAKVNNLSLYTSAIFRPDNSISVEAGLRYNKNSLYGDNLTYSFNPSFTDDNNNKVFVNISSAYRIPSLYQLYSEYGNRNLKPEETSNIEIGYQYQSAAARNTIRVVGFNRVIKNVIVFVTDPATYASLYQNRELQNDFGVEIEHTFRDKNLAWANNMTYVTGRGFDNGVKTNNLYRRPNVVFNSNLSVQLSHSFSLTNNIRAVGKRIKGIYDAGDDIMPAYYTWDMGLQYKSSKKWAAFVDVRNITNQTYFDIVGYNNRRFNFILGVSKSF